MIGGRVLDASALLDLATGATAYGRAVVDVAIEQGIVLAVPTVALSSAWSLLDERERPLLELLLDLPVVVVEPLTPAAARDVGFLAYGGGGPGVLDLAHAVQVARARSWAILTAEVARLRRLAPDVDLERLP